MKSVVATLAMLVLSGGFFDATWPCRACTAPRGGSNIEASQNAQETVTLAVAGMMKSKSGAT